MQTPMTAMFDTYADASRAVGRLKEAGVPQSDISILSNDPAARDAMDAEYRPPEAEENVAEAAGNGVAVGGSLGGGAGLLAGLGLLAIPGLGPVAAAGWVAATIVGASAGAVAGGLVASLTAAGVPADVADVYAEGLRRGATLVTVRASDDHLGSALDILDEEGTIQVAERAQLWRAEGWSGHYQDGAPGDEAPSPVNGP